MKTLPSGFRFKGIHTPLSISRAASHCLEFLEKLPFKEIVDSRTLAAAIGITLGSLRTHSVEPVLARNRHDTTASAGRITVWGSKRTIKELKKQLARKQQEAE